MKKRSKAQKFADYADAIHYIRKGKKVKRSGTKDGSIATHPLFIVTVPNLPEAKVLKNCMVWLKKKGILCNRNNVGSGQMGESGFYSYGIKNAGDIVGLLPSGQHFELEIKRGKGGRLSAGQQKRMNDVRRSNGIYFVIHGVQELQYYFAELI